ncbi:MAG: DNA-binding protein [Cyanobacteria bacterium P01_C01_bin.69]
MKEYEFTLIFSLQDPAEDPSDYEQALEKNDCTDALIGLGSKGSIALMFDRAADSAFEAISSAIAAVSKSIPHSTLTEAQPDLVGITDVAELVDKSRQNIRKLVYAEGSGCPLPVHNGSSALWHLHDMLVWLQQEKI